MRRKSISHTVVVQDVVVGTVWFDGCANAECRRAIKAGRPWHATPEYDFNDDQQLALMRQFIEKNHFATREQAERAVQRFAAAIQLVRCGARQCASGS